MLLYTFRVFVDALEKKKDYVNAKTNFLNNMENPLGFFIYFVFGDIKLLFF
jgi:hypothetical protein